MRNKVDPYFWCIHHEILPEDSFLRGGQVKYSPAVFEVWVRRDTLRKPIVEQTTHPDWEWLPRKRMSEATAWMQNRGQGVGDIKASDNLGRTNSPDWHWFILCEPEVLSRLKAIDWRRVALPTAREPTLTKGEVVRSYEESKRQALTPKYGAEPHGSWEPIGPFLRYGVDVLPDQPTSSVAPSSSPQPDEAQKSTNGGVLSDEYVSWWAQRFVQFRQDLRPGPLMAYIKEEAIDDQRSDFVVEFRVAMRPVQAGLPNTLFISACYPNENA
jgi:hypothetical protein